jgi:PAS domain S-box-containing protein
VTVDTSEKRTDQRFRSLVLATSSVLWTTDAQGRVVEPSDSWTRFTGQSFEEYRGAGWLDAIHPEDREHAKAVWAGAVSQRKLYEVEYRLRHRDGGWRNVIVRGTPILDETGQIREWVGNCVDITDRVSVEQALREEVRITDILHSMGMALAAELDVQKLVQRITDAATSVIRAKIGVFMSNADDGRADHQTQFSVAGVDHHSLADIPISRATEIFAPTFRNEGVIRLADVTTHPRFGPNPPFKGMLPGGAPARSYLGMSVVLRTSEVIGGLFFGHPDAGVFTSRDERILRGIVAQAAIAIDNARLVHDLRQTKQDLSKQLEELVGERTAELEVANSQLRASNRELQDFASVASHDLQEPLRKIQAFGDRLEAKSAEALGPEGRDYLQRMRNAAVRMQTLIGDLLQFSRITTRAQPFMPVDLGKIASEVLGDLETAVERSGGRVELGALPTIDADPTQMRQLFQNLIGNALKFRNPQMPPLVQVSAETDTELNRCKLIVRDNGIGFEEKYLDRIFNVFQRLHTRGAYEGTGIGLAVCRKIVERHGGSITARSAPDRGSTFIVTLPIRQPGTEEANA